MVKKPWYKSKTIWLNTLLTLLAIVDIVKGLKFIEPKMLLLAGGMLNAILRIWFTKIAVGMSA